MHIVLTVQLLNSRLVGGLFFLPSEMYPWFYLNCRDNFKLFESTSSLCGVLKKCFVAEEQWVRMNNWIQKVVKHFIPACLHFFSPCTINDGLYLLREMQNALKFHSPVMQLPQQHQAKTSKNVFSYHSENSLFMLKD